MTMGTTEEERLVVCTKLCNYKLQATAGYDAMFRPVEWSGFPVGFRQVSGRFPAGFTFLNVAYDVFGSSRKVES